MFKSLTDAEIQDWESSDSKWTWRGGNISPGVVLATFRRLRNDRTHLADCEHRLEPGGSMSTKPTTTDFDALRSEVERLKGSDKEHWKRACKAAAARDEARRERDQARSDLATERAAREAAEAQLAELAAALDWDAMANANRTLRSDLAAERKAHEETREERDRYRQSESDLLDGANRDAWLIEQAGLNIAQQVETIREQAALIEELRGVLTRWVAEEEQAAACTHCGVIDISDHYADCANAALLDLDESLATPTPGADALAAHVERKTAELRAQLEAAEAQNARLREVLDRLWEESNAEDARLELLDQALVDAEIVLGGVVEATTAWLAKRDERVRREEREACAKLAEKHLAEARKRGQQVNKADRERRAWAHRSEALVGCAAAIRARTDEASAEDPCAPRTDAPATSAVLTVRATQPYGGGPVEILDASINVGQKTIPVSVDEPEARRAMFPKHAGPCLNCGREGHDMRVGCCLNCEHAPSVDEG